MIDTVKVNSSRQVLPVISIVPSRGIIEDGKACPPTEPDVVYAYADLIHLNDNLKAEGSPRATAGFSAAGFARNSNARAFFNALKLDGSTSRTFLGVSEGNRTCGSNQYVTGTFFFFTKTSSVVHVTLQDVNGDSHPIMLLRNKATLVILDPKNKICFLDWEGMQSARSSDSLSPVESP